MQTTVEFLKEHYGGPLVRATKIGAMLGMSARTVSNNISLGKFIFPVVKVGKHNYVDIRDLAKYMDKAKNDAKFII